MSYMSKSKMVKTKEFKMIDYKLKAEVLKTDLCKKMKVVDRNNYLPLRDGLVIDKNNDDKYVDLLFKYGYKWIREARKINLASFRRFERLKERIKDYLLSGQCIFVTLTFRDDVLDSTSEETRRQYVSRYLKSISDKYVANIDYGVDDRYTKREHYHAVVLIDWISEKWSHGKIHREKVHQKCSEEKIGKYITKLCNHAIKESTKRCCYIYSRFKY